MANIPPRPPFQLKDTGTWLAVGLFWLFGQLPWNWQLAVGRALGRLSYLLLKRCRHIAATNIALCFPELSDAEQEALTKQTIVSTGEALTEIAAAYVNNRVDLTQRLTIEGLEHLQAAQQEGGVIMLGMHLNTIDAGCRLFGDGAKMPFSVVYRPNNNPILDWLIAWGRGRFVEAYIDRKDMRTMVRQLRAGGTVWYAPDQDYGREHSVFAPFFGVPAATITTTSRLAKMGKAAVVPTSHFRLPHGRYKIVFGPALDNFPSGDDVVDATLINQVIEREVLKAPEQYLWVHRRFKTRPVGEERLY